MCQRQPQRVRHGSVFTCPPTWYSLIWATFKCTKLPSYDFAKFRPRKILFRQIQHFWTHFTHYTVVKCVYKCCIFLKKIFWGRNFAKSYEGSFVPWMNYPVLMYVRTEWTVGTTIAQVYTVGCTVLYHPVLWYVRTGWTVWIIIGGVQYSVEHSILSYGTWGCDALQARYPIIHNRTVA